MRVTPPAKRVRIDDYSIENSPITALPEEILLLIFSFLPPRTLIEEIPWVNRSWRQIAQDPYLWNELKPQLTFPFVGQIKTIYKAYLKSQIAYDNLCKRSYRENTIRFTVHPLSRPKTHLQSQGHLWFLGQILDKPTPAFTTIYFGHDPHIRQVALNGKIASLSVGIDKIYIALEDNSVHVLDMANKEVSFLFETDSAIDILHSCHDTIYLTYLHSNQITKYNICDGSAASCSNRLLDRIIQIDVDAEYLYSAGNDCLSIRNVADLGQRHILRHLQQVLGFNVAGKRVIAVCENSLYFWDIPSGSRTHIFNHLPKSPIILVSGKNLFFSNRHNRIVQLALDTLSSAADAIQNTFEMKSLKLNLWGNNLSEIEMCSLSRHLEPISCIQLHEYLLFSSSRDSLRVWDLIENCTTFTLSLWESTSPTCLSIHNSKVILEYSDEDDRTTTITTLDLL